MFFSLFIIYSLNNWQATSKNHTKSLKMRNKKMQTTFSRPHLINSHKLFFRSSNEKWRKNISILYLLSIFWNELMNSAFAKYFDQKYSMCHFCSPPAIYAHMINKEKKKFTQYNGWHNACSVFMFCWIQCEQQTNKKAHTHAKRKTLLNSEHV